MQTQRHFPGHTTTPQHAGAARDSGVEVITSARVTSIVRGETTNEDSNSNDLADGVTEIDHAQSPSATPPLELTFTAANQLSRKVCEALGAVALVAPPNEEEADGNQASSRERVTYRVACDYVLQATGASREGHAWAANLGHDVSVPVPSLFTFTINDPRHEYHSGHCGTGFSVYSPDCSAILATLFSVPSPSSWHMT